MVEQTTMKIQSLVGSALISNKTYINQRIKALQFCKAFFLFGFLIFCVSCEAFRLSPTNYIGNLAAKNNWQRFTSKHDYLTVVGFFKPKSNSSEILHVYIEGDGAPWIYPWMPPENPTPFRPIAFELALKDPHPNVLYMARPCQLTIGKEREGCQVELWTNARFSMDVVNSTNTAISRFLKSINGKKVVLFGYSGGGAVATLVAAQRNDTLGIITVSGTLDHAIWTSYHNVSPLKQSLNPISYSKKLSKIPQVHFIGEDDAIMPKVVAKSYLKSLKKDHKAKIVSLFKYDHSCCWVDNWSNLLKKVSFTN